MFQPFKKEDHKPNALYFFFDFFPITLELEKRQVGFFGFLIRISAVVGGGFAIMGFLDKLVYGIEKVIGS